MLMHLQRRGVIIIRGEAFDSKVVGVKASRSHRPHSSTRQTPDSPDYSTQKFPELTVDLRPIIGALLTAGRLLALV